MRLGNDARSDSRIVLFLLWCGVPHRVGSDHPGNGGERRRSNACVGLLEWALGNPFFVGERVKPFAEKKTLPLLSDSHHNSFDLSTCGIKSALPLSGPCPSYHGTEYTTVSPCVGLVALL